MSYRTLNLKATAKLLNSRADLIEKALCRIQASHQFVDISRLGFLDSFYFYCVLLSAGKSWGAGELPSFSSCERKLASTRTLVEKIYSSLYVNRVLAPNTKSSLFAFNIGAALDAPITFDLTQVCWTIGRGGGQSDKRSILTLLCSNLDSSKLSDRERLRLMLIQHECTGVFLEILAKNGVIAGRNEELEIFKLVKKLLAFLSPPRLILELRKAFGNRSFKKNINDASKNDMVPLLTELLRKQVRTVSFAEPRDSLESTSENSILEVSQNVVSSTFCERFLAIT